MGRQHPFNVNENIARFFGARHAVFCLSLCAIVCGCSRGTGALDGRVIDSEHGGAAVGAFVVLTRERGNLFWSGTVCEDQEVAITDTEGRFHFGGWSPPVRSIWDVVFPTHYWRDIAVYKPGFRIASPIPINETFQGLVALNNLDASPELRLAEIRGLGLDTHCLGFGDGGYSDTLKPLLVALEAEARELATTPEQLDTAIGVFHPGRSTSPRPPTPPIQIIVRPAPNSPQALGGTAPPGSEPHQ